MLTEILGWESLVILVLIAANGLFSMSEIALVSSRKARLQQMADEGDAKARKALDLIVDPGRFLATVQVGITLVGTLAGAYGGVAIAENLAVPFRTLPWLAEYAEVAALIVVVVVVTYFQVVLGELVPKALALRHAETISRQVAGFMTGLSRGAGPVVQFLNLSTKGLLRLFGIRAQEEAAVTEEEIALMLTQGTKAGLYHESQQEMMESVIGMGDRRITSLMTPRPDVEWLDSTADLAEIRAKLVEHPYSRFPVCRGGFDDLVGVVHAKDLLSRALAGQTLDLEALSRPVPIIPASVDVLKALETFRSSGATLALVSDEYGSILGLVTLDDVLRDILGDVATAQAHAGDEPDAVQRADGSWLAEGTMPVDDVKDLLDLKNLHDGDEEDDSQTLGGFVMARLGRIPRAGELFESAGWRYEVIDMDGHRVDKVLITRVNTGDEAANQKSET
jgi:putative hemolysin